MARYTPTFTIKTTSVLALILVLTSPASLANAQLNVGCYASGLMTDQVEAPILPGLSAAFHDIYMSQGACTAHCKTNQYLYAIAVGGTSCYCTNESLPEGSRVQDDKCNKPCVGYPLETCGSAFLGAVTSSGGGVYANVMLASNSLSIPHTTPIPSPSPTSLSPQPSQQTVDDKHSESSSQLLPTATSTPDPVVTTATAVVGTVRPQPEIRNDAEGVKPSGKDTADATSDEDEGPDEEKDDTDHTEDDEEPDGDGEDEEGYDDESSDDPEPGDSHESVAGQDAGTKPSLGIPVASTAVAVVCALGICVFIVYATRKRKRERARVARVNSVFDGSDRGVGSVPYKSSSSKGALDRNTPGRIMSYLPYQQEDLESVSDGQSEMVDRRRSMPMIGRLHRPTLALDMFSRPDRGSIMVPAATARTSRALGRSFSHQTTLRYPQRAPSGSTVCNDPGFYSDQYEEFYEQEGGESGVEAYPSKVASSSHAFAPRPASQPYSSSNHISVHPLQLPYRPVQASNPVRPAGRHNYDDPFQDTAATPQHPHGHHYHQRSIGSIQHQKTQRHSIHSTPTGNGTLWHHPAVSDYRRPHSFALSSNRLLDGVEEREAPIRYRTRVLEDNDGESTDSEAALTTSKFPRRVTTSSSAFTGKLSGSLKQQFKRLSTPYVQAIRQQQQQHERQSQQQQQPLPKQQHQRVSVLSCIEEGHGGIMDGGGNESDSSMPVPGPSPVDRRWSRGLLKSVVGHHHMRSSKDQGRGPSESRIEEMHGEDVASTAAVEVGASHHRQVHSGSLASFRGLDDPNRPQLRVTNPDDIA
ncbi:hypothetical protein BGX31_010810 [Mortierella sp. GBA43]|nr:hypothetical protein BGX31_010810 [Mortierella sp. GBA43]